MEKILIFTVGSQTYALDAACISEIRGKIQPTPLPGSPKEILGIINIRGKIFPVIDSGFRLSSDVVGEKKVIIIVESEEKSIGILVDNESDIEDSSKFTLQILQSTTPKNIQNLVTAIMSEGDRMIFFLEAEKIISEIAAV